MTRLEQKFPELHRMLRAEGFGDKEKLTWAHRGTLPNHILRNLPNWAGFGPTHTFKSAALVRLSAITVYH